MKKFLSPALAVAILAAAPVSASAGQTDWIGISEWKSLESKLRASGEVPVSVQCRDRGGPLNNESGQAKISTQKKDVEWHWAFGSQFQNANYKWVSQGFTQAAGCEYARPKSGVKIKFGVWHKKK